MSNDDPTASRINRSSKDPVGPTRSDEGNFDSQSFIDGLQGNGARPPSKIQRYEIELVLGQGGFGTVYLAYDPHLNRKVAIKVPRLNRPIDQVTWNQFVHEGRAIANLDHPSIIRVYDINRQENQVPFVVMEYIEGRTLRHLYNDVQPSLEDAISIIRQVTEGLLYAHKNNIVHRDLKPANIMIDIAGQVRIADFGLAIHDNTPLRRVSKNRAGTLAFMAPEQIRGENHRLDGRTDLWAFGVVIYWMFTACYPFRGENATDISMEICSRDPKPMRQINDKIPREIERICNRCLHRLMEERYQSAADLLEDVEYLQQNLRLDSLPTSAGPTDSNFSRSKKVSGSKYDSNLASRGSVSRNSGSQIQVVPKGLRSFDAGDTEFFLSLLPGPTDRFGVPESIRFWLQQLVDTDVDLPIGLLYGPSGCGKSSFVRAGLIPRMPEEFEAVYIECTSGQTELDLCQRLRRKFDDLESDTGGLAFLLNQIRTSRKYSGRRLLIVLDQLEQWLYGNEIVSDSPLVEALRQCDGERVQCLLLVRDDFWMPTQQFFRELGVKIQDGKNTLALPLFDLKHSRKVLAGFGRAYDTLPGEKFTRGQRDFIRTAVEHLSNNGTVICAHLALFSEMMAGREWTKAELSRLGNWQGVAVSYLEDLFASSASISLQNCLPAVRQLLFQLLPDSGATIKGSGRSEAELIKACSEIQNETQFNALVDGLETNLRLVARTADLETDSSHEVPSNHTKVKPKFLLAHDILVEPLRTWLTLKQRESWKGRAEIRLDELTNQWKTKKAKRLLPSLPEYVSILFGTKRQSRSLDQMSYLKAANIFYVWRALLLGLVAVLGYIGLSQVSKRSLRSQVKAEIESTLNSRPDAVPFHIATLENHASIASDLLADWPMPSTPQQRLHLQMLGGHFSSAMDMEDVWRQVESMPGDEFANLIDATSAMIRKTGDKAILADLVKRADAETMDKKRIRLSLMAMQLGNVTAIRRCLSDVEQTNRRTQFVHEFPKWVADLEVALSRFSQIDDPGIHVLVCKSLSLMAEESYSGDERLAVEEWLTQAYETCLHSGVHFAAKHALERWRIDFDPNLNVPNAPWKVRKLLGKYDVEFVRIEAGEIAPFGAGMPNPRMGIYKNLNPKIEHSYWFGAKEVSADMFYKFVISDEADPEIKKEHLPKLEAYLNKDLPVVGVSRNDAAQFCNWLNWQSGYDKTYEYVKHENKVFDTWKQVEGANGFRLPTDAEWEVACRAGSTTAYFFGGKRYSQFLPNYVWCNVSSYPFENLRVGQRGKHLPNDLGIFDVIGNGREPVSNSAIAQEGVNRYSLRGGGANSSSSYYLSSNIFSDFSSSRSSNNSIRIVINDI